MCRIRSQLKRRSREGRVRLDQLTTSARRSGFRLDKSVLVFEEYSDVKYFADKNLVDFLANSGFYPQ